MRILIAAAAAAILLPSVALADDHKKAESAGSITYEDAKGARMTVFAEGYMVVQKPGSDRPGVVTTYVTAGDVHTLNDVAGPRMCSVPGVYRTAEDDGVISITLVRDECEQRKSALDGATWRPVETTDVAMAQ